MSRITRAAVGLGTLALLASPLALGAQQPTKKAPRDTATRHIKVVKAPVAADTHTHVVVAQGEVAQVASCCASQDSLDHLVAALDHARAEAAGARHAQWLLDSIATAQRLSELAGQARANATRMMDDMHARMRAQRDSIENARQLALRASLARGWYVGVAGGVSTPQRDIRNGYAGGWNVTAPVGWDASSLPLGFRADVAVDRLNGTQMRDAQQTTIAASGSLTVWSLNTDLKLRLGAPGTTRSHLYVLGGLGAARITNGVYGYVGPDAGRDLSFGDAATKLSWNAGGGASFAWGRSELFVESRFIQVKSDQPYHATGGIGTYTSFAPIVVGLQWF